MIESGWVALVTGAGTGIGLACARMLAASGVHMVLVGRRAAPLEAAASELAAQTQCVTHPADVADLDAAARAVDVAIGRFGRLDIVINNAGYAPSMPLDRVTPEQIERVFRVNAMGPAAIIARAWPVMARQGGGCIVNMSSYATIDPFPGLGVYGAAKASLNLLAKACHNEGRTLGIRAFAVAPGAVETQMLRALVPREMLPTSRTLSPEQVAQVVLACIRGDRDAESGQTILLPSP